MGAGDGRDCGPLQSRCPLSARPGDLDGLERSVDCATRQVDAAEGVIEAHACRRQRVLRGRHEGRNGRRGAQGTESGLVEIKKLGDDFFLFCQQ